MPFVPAIGCVRLVPEFASGSVNVGVNTLNFRSLTDVTLATMTGLATMYSDIWTETAAPYVANTLRLTRIVVTDLTVSDGLQVTQEYSGGIAGTNTSPPLPNNVTLATAFKSIYAGRSRRGRAYWIGLSENLVAGDDVLATPAENIRAFWQQIGDSSPASDYQHVVLSYVTGGVARTEALATDVTTYINVDNHVDSQRRRLIG